MSDESQDELYNVTLRVSHPNEVLHTITNELGLQPHYKWQAGQPRAAPNGAPLPGVNRDTYWAHAVRIAGHRYFFKTVVELLEKLEAAEEYVHGLIASGGRVSLIVHLPGHTNIGDMIAPADLLRLGRLGVGLGVEVFPDMR